MVDYKAIEARVQMGGLKAAQVSGWGLQKMKQYFLKLRGNMAGLRNLTGCVSEWLCPNGFDLHLSLCYVV